MQSYSQAKVSHFNTVVILFLYLINEKIILLVIINLILIKARKKLALDKCLQSLFGKIIKLFDITCDRIRK